MALFRRLVSAFACSTLGLGEFSARRVRTTADISSASSSRLVYSSCATLSVMVGDDGDESSDFARFEGGSACSGDDIDLSRTEGVGSDLGPGKGLAR